MQTIEFSTAHLLDHIDEAILVVDRHEKICFANNKMLSSSKTDLTKIRNCCMFDVFKINKPSLTRKKLQRVFEFRSHGYFSQIFHKHFIEIPLEDDHFMQQNVSFSPIVNCHDEVFCLIQIIDVTDVVDHVARLTQKNSGLAKINDFKNDLLAVCSHDLKSPLAVITSVSEMLLDEEFPLDNDEKEKFFKIIANQSRYGLELISDILGKARDNQMIVLLHKEDVVVCNKITTIVEGQKQLYNEKKVSLSLSVDPMAANLEVVMDFRRLEQVVRNILSNALRFVNENGFVKVSVDIIASHKATISTKVERILWLKFANNGTAIPSHKLEGIFNKFEQGDVRSTADQVGLGLSICKEIIQLHGGEIWAESETELTVFHIQLPIYLPQVK